MRRVIIWSWKGAKIIDNSNLSKPDLGDLVIIMIPSLAIKNITENGKWKTKIEIDCDLYLMFYHIVWKSILFCETAI